jgi:hypothetical protein
MPHLAVAPANDGTPPFHPRDPPQATGLSTAGVVELLGAEFGIAE